MTWTTAISDLRTLLSDNGTDKLRYRKAIVGLQNGTNTTFKTFEFRRLTPFVGATGLPYGVFKNGVLTSVASEDLPSGGFVLSVAPANGDRIEGTYYIQWFTDAELAVFLKSATQWQGFGADVTAIVDSFQPSALKYAAADAYQKLALRWAEHLSETYRLEEGPGEQIKAAIESYKGMAAQYRKEAFKERDDVYTRKGEANAPAWRTVAGNFREITPKR